MTRDGALEPVSRDQFLGRAQRHKGKIQIPCSADHGQDWQPWREVILQSDTCDDVHINRYRNTKMRTTHAQREVNNFSALVCG